MRSIQVISLALAGAAIANAAVLSTRAGLGGLQCNIARIKIVSALGSTSDNVAKIQDATVKDAAQAGVDQANDGIGQIAKALLSGQAPPQEGRDITEAGLTAAGTALAGGDTSDAAVADAQKSLADAVAAGQDVVAKC